jgi:hypothetical protein
MSMGSVLAPVFVLVAMVYGLMLAMTWARRMELTRGRVRPEDIALGQKAWTGTAAQTGNSYSNQFELPVLFFALVPLVLITHQADLVFVVLEWLFVLCRIVQAAIHSTTNYLPLRGSAFSASAIVLAIAWIGFAVKILMAS